MKFSVRAIILTGIFASITAIFSQIAIPLPFSQAITLQLVAVYLSGIILGYKYGPLSQIIYLIIGAAGAPVFANFHGGLSVLAGPSGGFLLSFPVIALIIGLFIKNKKKITPLNLILPLIAGLLVCYAFGAIWFSFVMNTNLLKSIIIVILPYLPLDIIKILFICLVGYKIRNSLVVSNLIKV